MRGSRNFKGSLAALDATWAADWYIDQVSFCALPFTRIDRPMTVPEGVPTMQTCQQPSADMSSRRTRGASSMGRALQGFGMACFPCR
jgi:hypothetical protein